MSKIKSFDSFIKEEISLDQSAIGPYDHIDHREDPNTHYPELDAAVLKLDKYIVAEINKVVDTVQSQCPYPGQYMIETLVDILTKKI